MLSAVHTLSSYPDCCWDRQGHSCAKYVLQCQCKTWFWLQPFGLQSALVLELDLPSLGLWCVLWLALAPFGPLALHPLAVARFHFETRQWLQQGMEHTITARRGGTLALPTSRAKAAHSGGL